MKKTREANMDLLIIVAFMNLHIHSEKLSRAIISVAPLTLGVYLIHAHANVSPWSWEFFNLPSKMSSLLFPLMQIACVIGIFIVCSAIDALRKVTIGRVENAKFTYVISDNATTYIAGFLKKLF